MKKVIMIISCVLIMVSSTSMVAMAAPASCHVHGIHQMHPRGGGSAYEGNYVSTPPFIEGSLYQCDCGETIVFDGHFSVELSGYLGRFLLTQWNIINPTNPFPYEEYLLYQDPNNIMNVHSKTLPGYQFYSY
ncbi:MAG: hypothetical protein N4A63_12385 [Vallitalea sp.]|jgi:hypothetical protein|nr:hypothetical protein [Vallitalea sp.]